MHFLVFQKMQMISLVANEPWKPVIGKAAEKTFSLPNIVRLNSSSAPTQARFYQVKTKVNFDEESTTRVDV